MPLPKSIQRQAAEADRLVRNINGANEPPPPDDTPPEVQPNTPPVVQAQPVPPTPPATPQPIAQPPAAPQPNEWEQRYHTLQGKYNAEVPQLQGQLQNAIAAVGNMGRELDQLKAQLAQVRATPPAPPIATQVTAQDMETWGSDMIDVIRRGAQEEAQKLLQPVMQENAQLREQVRQLTGTTEAVQQTQQQTREEVFFQRLQEVVPDWMPLNNDQQYIAWLQVYEPMLRKTRQDALREARAALDVQGVAAFFNAYKATLPPPVVNPTAELARQVSPQRTRAAAPQLANGGTQQQVEIWSQEEISQFYTDVSRGRYRHNPQEAEEMNRRITQAVAEGRVR